MKKWFLYSCLLLLLLPLSVYAEDRQDVEPNNVQEQAGKIAPFSKDTTIVGQLSDENDNDFYALTTERTGLRVQIKTNPQVEIALHLYASNGTQLQAWYGEKQEAQFINLFEEGLAEGTYYLKVSAHQGQGRDIPYEVRLMKETTLSYEAEMNDEMKTATKLDFGKPLGLFIDDVGRQDILTFTVKEQGIVTFDFLASDYADYSVTIFDSQQNKIDYFPVERDESGEYTEMARHGLRPGNYYIRIVNEESDFANAFTALTITFKKQSHVELEPNNTIALAFPLKQGETKQGIVYTNQDVDYFKFVHSKKAVVTLSIQFKQEGTISAIIATSKGVVKTMTFTGKNQLKLSLPKGTYTIKLMCKSKQYTSVPYTINWK